MEDSNKALEQCLQESEMSISERLDPSPKHDAGHYVNLPLVRNEKTLEIADGETFEKVYVLGGDTGALSELPFANVIVGAGAKVNIVVVIMPGTSIDLPLAVDIVGEDAGSSEFACHDGEDSCACACVNNVTISYAVFCLKKKTKYTKGSLVTA